MSSKRKNTPTKLAKDEVGEEMENGTLEGHDSDVDSETGLTIQMGKRDTPSPEEGVDYGDGGSPISDPGSDRPQSKKQRLLQSIRDDSDEEELHNNNNIMTKPSPIGLNHRKSMDTVLRRLNKGSDISRPNEDDLLENLKAHLSSSDNTEDKERKLAEMINQLQTLRESIKKEKDHRSRSAEEHVSHDTLIGLNIK